VILLRNRVRRLEARVIQSTRPSLAELLRDARERSASMTPAELDDERRSRCLQALNEPDAPVRTLARDLQNARRRMAVHYLKEQA
jgi:hypothetical protein